MLKEGDKLPEFSGVDQDNNLINSKDYIGKKLVIFFYPKASTPGCTKQACNLNDNIEALKENGYEVIGVSADTVKRQNNFSTKYNLSYPLIADTEKEIINAFGVWGPKKFMGKSYEGINRTTFIINESGTIERVIDKVKTADHATQILN